MSSSHGWLAQRQQLSQQDVVFFLLSNKMYAIFAMLFGLTFFIQHDNQAKRGYDFRPRFAWRMVLLFMFGLLDLVFYNGDILTVYAVGGLLVLPFVRASDKVVAVVAAVLALQPIELVYFIGGMADPQLQPLNLGSAGMFEAILPAQADGSLLDVAKAGLLYGLPVNFAWAIEHGRFTQTLFLFLTIIPFWTSSLIRIYAWINLLSTEGLVNNILLALGIINEPLHLIYNLFAVILVLVYMYLPFAILPLFTAFDRFDFTLVDAARDLGSSKLGALVRIMLPSVRSGITTALVFTAIPVFGAYTVPLLVGGMGSTMVGNIIVDQVQKTRNWPLASAFSVILTLVSLIGVLTVLRGGRKDKKSKEVRT